MGKDTPSAAHTRMTEKTLSVLGDDGAGKKTLIGSLIYKCGLELPQLEELERHGVGEYSGIVPFFEERERPLSFHGPSARFLVSKTATPDVAIWVVDATTSTDGKASSAKLVSLLSSGELRPRGKLLIAVNKMDGLNWSEDRFSEISRAFTDADLGLEKSSIIPISCLLQGGNVLESSEEPSWVKLISPLVRQLA